MLHLHLNDLVDNDSILALHIGVREKEKSSFLIWSVIALVELVKKGHVRFSFGIYVTDMVYS